MDIGKQLLNLGHQMNDGLLDKESGRQGLEKLRERLGMSDRQFKKICRKEKAKIEHKYKAEIADLTLQENQLLEVGDLLESVTNTSITVAGAIHKLKSMFPKIWETVAQRIYKHVDAYGDYRLAYLEWGFAHLLHQWHQENGEPNTYPHQMVLDIFNLHKEHGFPFFFVSKGICEAAWQSDLKFAVDWKTMHLPFEAFTFVLPKENPLDYDGITVYRHTKDGDMHFTLFALGNAGLGTEITADYPFTAQNKGDDDTLRWVFNTIYAMSARPEYVEGGERIGTKKGTRSEIWMPNVIGRKYATKSHSFHTISSQTRRMHWRRGHFRQQPYGIGRLQHKIIWLEPMLVNATVTEG